MKKLFLILSIALVLAFPSCDLSSLFEDSEGGATVEPSPDDDSNTLLGIPSQAKSGEKLIEHDAYTVLYSLEDLVPVWVSWHVDADDLGNLDRDGITFSPDPSITDKKYSVTHDDFTSSGFDRGHICPNADRDSSETLQLETFYTTNVAAQNWKLNQQDWKYLEEDIRGLVEDDGYEAYVVAGVWGEGGLNKDNKKMTEYDRDDEDELAPITVPGYFWKVAVLLKDGNGDLSRIDKDTDVIAVWFPNEPVPDDKAWTDYICSVDYVEEKTNLDFFSAVSDDIESYLERNKWIDEGNIF